MATPESATRFFGDLHDVCSVREWPNWREHNRGTHGDGWGPVHGVMIHHTVTKSTKAAIQYAYDGDPLRLPGPLYNVVVDKQGTAHLIGWGRANHAGGGDGDVLAHVIREQLPLPKPRLGEGDPGARDGNACFYGIGLLNLGDGRDGFPDVQLDTAATAAALLCAYHGWSERSVIGHKEWSNQKIDPRFSMASFRRRVAGRLTVLREALDAR